MNYLMLQSLEFAHCCTLLAQLSSLPRLAPPPPVNTNEPGEEKFEVVILARRSETMPIFYTPRAHSTGDTTDHIWQLAPPLIRDIG